MYDSAIAAAFAIAVRAGVSAETSGAAAFRAAPLRLERAAVNAPDFVSALFIPVTKPRSALEIPLNINAPSAISRSRLPKCPTAFPPSLVRAVRRLKPSESRLTARCALRAKEEIPRTKLDMALAALAFICCAPIAALIPSNRSRKTCCAAAICCVLCACASTAAFAAITAASCFESVAASASDCFTASGLLSIALVFAMLESVEGLKF